MATLTEGQPGGAALIAANENATSSTTLVLTLTTGVAAGDAIVIGWGTGGSGIQVSSVADTDSQSWTIYNPSGGSGGSRPSGFIVATAVNAMATNDTITITWSSTTQGAAEAYKVPNNAQVLAVDVSPAGTNGFSTAPSASTGTLGKSNSMCWGVICNQNAGGTPTSPSWTSQGTANTSGQLFLSVYTKQLSGATTASQTCSATLSTNVFWSAAVLTIYAAPLGITGAGSLTAPATLEPVASLTGTGTLTALAAEDVTASVAGAGTLTAPATIEPPASIAGAGTLTAPATLGPAALIAGAGSLSAPATLGAVASLTGAGTLSAPAEALPVASLAGAGSMTAPVAEEVTGAIAGAGSLTAAVTREPGAGLIGRGSLTAAPVRPGEAVVTVYGQPGTFGFLAGLTETPTGQSLITAPVEGWQFGKGEAVFYSRATTDGQVVMSTVAFTNNELSPTADHAEICVFNPQGQSFYRQLLPTSTGATVAAEPGKAYGGTDAGAGDIAVVHGSDDVMRVLTTQTGYYFGWPGSNGLYPALAFWELGGDDQWDYAPTRSLTGDQWYATNPALFSSVMAPAGQAHGNGFNYWSPRFAAQMAVLPDGNVVIGHYFGFGGPGSTSGGISVVDPDGNLLAAFQLGNITPLSGTMSFCAVRDVEADPTSDPAGIQYFALIYDAFGTNLRETFQIWSYDHAAQVIAPVSVPCCPGDDKVNPSFCVFTGPDHEYPGTLIVTCGSGLSGLASLAAGNTQVYYKTGGAWAPVSQAPVFGGWESASWPTPVTADDSLGFPVAFGLGALGGPPVIDPQSGALLIPSPATNLGISVPQGGGLGPNLLSTFASTLQPPQLLTADDAAFATGLGSWTAFDGFTAWVADPLGGGHAMQMDQFGGGSVYQTGRYTALPSTPYQHTVSFLTGSAPRSCGAFVQYYDSGGSLIVVTPVTTITDATGAYTAATVLSTSPSNAATYAIFAEVLSQGSEHHYLKANSAYSLSAAPSGWTGFFGTALQLAQLGPSLWALAMTAQLSSETMSATQPPVAVVPYQEYVLAAQFRAGTVPEPCTVQVIWKNAGGGTVSTSLVTMSATDATSGLATAQCSAMAPAAAVSAVAQVLAFAATAGEVHYVTGITFQAQPWQALPALNYEIAGIRTIYGTAGCGRGCVINGVFYVPVQTTFTSAESAAYNAGGYVPQYKPQFLVAIDLKQVIPADDPVPYLAGQNARSYPVTGMPPPGAESLPVDVTMRRPGDWLIAVIAWRQPGYGAPVTVSVEDDAAGGRNYWDVLQPDADSPAAGTMRTAIWAAPAARVPEHVMIAPTGYCLAIAATIIGIPSDLVGPWVSSVGVTGIYADGSAILPFLVSGAPSGPAIMITGAGGDDVTTVLSGLSGAWTYLPQAGSSSGADSSTDIIQRAAWQFTPGVGVAGWAATGSQDLAAVITGVLTAAPPPADVSLPGVAGFGPTWPGAVRAQLAVGSGAGTPPSQQAWASVTARSLSARFGQGRQYTLGQLRAGQGWMALDNPDLALIPPGTGQFAGIDSGTPWRVLLIFPASDTPYYVWGAGYVQRWPPAWAPDTQRGLTTATLTDTWGYANKLLRSVARSEILSDGPVLYAPCADPAGAIAAANIAPGGLPPLAVQSSKSGVAGASQQFGAQAVPPLLGDVATTVTASGPASSGGGGTWQQGLANSGAGETGGFSLGCASGAFPPVEGALTAEFWFQIQAPVQAAGTLLFAWCKSHAPPGDVYPHGVLIWVDTPPAEGGTGKLTLFTSFGSVPSVARIGVGGTDYTAGAVPPLTHVAITFGPNAWTSYVNGVRSAGGSWGTQLKGVLPYLSVNGASGLPWPVPGLGSFIASSYAGLAAHVALFAGALPAGRILAHYYAGLGYAGESPSQRIERLMQAGGMTGRRLILPDTGPWVAPAVSCQDIGGQPAATGITNMAASTTPAVLAVAPTGAPFYLARQYAYNQPVQWVLGDGEGEYPFLPDFAPDYDPVRVVNDVQVTQLDDSSVQVPQLAAQEQASQDQYGPQSSGGQITGYLQHDSLSGPGSGAGCVDLANWIADVNTVPGLRIAQVTVDAAAHPEAWPFVAGVTVGDLVTCNFRPPTAPDGSLVTVTGRITSTDRALQFDLTGVTGSVTCVVDLAPEMAVLTAGDPVLGQVNGKNPMAW